MGQDVDQLELGFSLVQCLWTKPDFEKMPYARFGGCTHNILRDPEGGRKHGNVNNLEILVEVIGLRCMLTQDVEGMPHAMFDGVTYS